MDNRRQPPPTRSLVWLALSIPLLASASPPDLNAASAERSSPAPQASGLFAPLSPGEVTPVRWYRDGDGDGYGDPLHVVLALARPEGYVAHALDCDDRDAGLNPETLWYMDSDGDGFGDDAFTLIQCARPEGYVQGAGDCDDTDPAYHPGAQEGGLDAEAQGDFDCDGHVGALDQTPSESLSAR